MPRRFPFFSHNLEGQLCCHGVPVPELIEDTPLEYAYHLLLLQKKPSEEEAVFFHEQARDLRAKTVQEVSGKQPMYAPAMNTLQSLSSCITVSYNDWDYLNQLLITYSSFFEEDLFFYENYAQQLWKFASRRSNIDFDFNIFQKVAIFLAFSGHDTAVGRLLEQSCQAGVTLPLLIALGVGYNSGSRELGHTEQFFPFFRDLSLMSVEKKLKKYLKNKWHIPGFGSELPMSQEFYHRWSEQVLRHAVQQHKESAPLYEVVARAETVLRSEGLELGWSSRIAMALAIIGVEERLLPATMTLAQIPGWMGLAQYHSEAL